MIRDNLPFVVIGLTTGSVYGLMSVGLVLTYKTSGIYNLAHGAIAALSITFFSIFWRFHHWPLWVSLVICVPVLGFVVGSVLERVARRLNNASATHKVVATVGLLLVFEWLGPTAQRVILDKLWKVDLQSLFRSGAFRPGRGFGALQWLPASTSTIFDVVVGHDQMVIVAVALLATILLWALLRVTRLGVSMRAVVDNPELLELTGTSPSRVRRWAWTIGASYACLGGLLLSNRASGSSQLTPLVVQATGAAAFGAFGSIPLAYVGGITLGIMSALATNNLHGSILVQGIPVAMPFLFLFAALLVVPKRRLAEAIRSGPAAVRRSVATRIPRGVRIAAIVALYGLLVLIPVLANDLQPWLRVLSYACLCLGLGVLARTSGQISLCHYAFAAVGACAFHGYAAESHMPWLIALVLAGLTAVPVGALIAIPAIRLSGVFLALATFAFAYGMQFLLYSSSFMFKVGQFLMPRPSIAQEDNQLYYVILACLTVLLVGVILLERSRLGRLLAALSDSPTALETHGTTINVTRVLVFCISAFMAAIGGALLGCSMYFVGDGSFSAFASLTLLTVVMVAPGRSPWHAFPAALALGIMNRDVVIPDVNWKAWHLGFMTDYLGLGSVNGSAQFIVGALAVGVALAAYPPTRRSLVRTFLDRRRRVARPAGTDVAAEPMAAIEVPEVMHVGATLPALHRPVRDDDAGLVIDDLVVKYGSLVAVDDLSLRAPMGRITGLIGPNGAGKSTTFDACCGLLHPTHGTVRLHGVDVSSKGPAARARLGLGRTFQRVQLWGSLSVGDNVALGREGAMAGSSPLRQVFRRSGEASSVREAADWAMDACGITHLRDLAVGGLTTSERRLVELARCLASSSDLLLLDEPSSGLDASETDAFGRILREVVDRDHIGVLLVEHDMSLVMDVCEHIYVLDVGLLIAEGAPDAIRASDVVRAAYLGVDEVVATS